MSSKVPMVGTTYRRRKDGSIGIEKNLQLNLTGKAKPSNQTLNYLRQYNDSEGFLVKVEDLGEECCRPLKTKCDENDECTIIRGKKICDGGAKPLCSWLKDYVDKKALQQLQKELGRRDNFRNFSLSKKIKSSLCFMNSKRLKFEIPSFHL